MRVGTGNDTVIKHNLLAEVGAEHAPLGAVQNIVLTDALKRNAEHMSAVDIVGTHRNRLALRTDGVINLVTCDIAVLHFNISAGRKAIETGIRRTVIALTLNGMMHIAHSGVGAANRQTTSVVGISRFRLIGNGLEEAALDDQLFFINRNSGNGRDARIVPVDAAERIVPSFFRMKLSVCGLPES